MCKHDAAQYRSFMLEVGARVRGWTVTMPLDSSTGMAALLAEDASGRSVVLRVPEDLAGIERIRQEADLARLHVHEGLVACVGIVEHNGWPVQIVEHVDGMTLDALGLIAGALPPQALCRVGRQIALALVELHERPPFLFHGALSAERIVVDDGGNARLADLGRWRPQDNLRLISPERRAVQGKPTAADDLWALGMILAELALGHPLETGGAFLDVRVLAGALPDRLVDALAVLVGPAAARLRNATAAVRVFTELEKIYGDGARALRDGLAHARLGSAFSLGGDDDDDDEHPVTQPDRDKALFGGMLKDAGADDAGPATVEIPRTIEMSRDAVLGVADLRRLLQGPQPAVDTVPLAVTDEPARPRVRRDDLDDERTDDRAGERGDVAGVDVDARADVLAAGLGGRGAMIAAGVAVLAALLAVSFVLGMAMR